MKNILIVIHDMESGGGQRSLLSFLKCLEKSGKLINYKIDLLIAKPTGIFFPQLPSGIRILPINKELLWLGTSLGDKILKDNFSIKGLFGKIKWKIRKKSRKFIADLNEEQQLWECWKKFIPLNQIQYDIAISYMNGFPNYYVIDKVIAKKKILWIHNEYQKLRYNSDYDRPYYEKCDRIITISQKCLESFVEVFPSFKNKIYILENITISDDILKLGNQNIKTEYENCHKLKVLSIGRLSEQKGFDLAINAAKILKKSGLDFLWLIIGEGPDREKLQLLITKNKLNDCVKLIGLRKNPYVYIKQCNLFVQSSRFEGKSIVLDEAKIFCKPIVVTNYDTVFDSIRNKENGLIVDMNSKAIASGIQLLINNKEIALDFTRKLKNTDTGYEKELNKYIQVMINI